MSMALEATTGVQELVDARLDTIDRMLFGRVSRQDRLAIVREVEVQIHELLDGRELEALSRYEVLEILGRLDPPEAYLPEGVDPLRRLPASSVGARPEGSQGPTAPRIGTGLHALILGIVSILGAVWMLFSFFAAMLFGNKWVLIFGSLTGLLVSLCTGVLAIVLGALARRRNGRGWAGLFAGIVGVFLGPLVGGSILIWFLIELSA